MNFFLNSTNIQRDACYEMLWAHLPHSCPTVYDLPTRRRGANKRTWNTWCPFRSTTCHLWRCAWNPKCVSGEKERRIFLFENLKKPADKKDSSVPVAGSFDSCSNRSLISCLREMFWERSESSIFKNKLLFSLAEIGGGGVPGPCFLDLQPSPDGPEKNWLPE